MAGNFTKETVALLWADPERLACIQAVQQLRLPDWYIVAGFVRNAIWDHIMGKGGRSEIQDVDVAFFDSKDMSVEAEQDITQRLLKRLPDIRWEVRNQARMHRRNGHPRYESTLDAISYYPELQTCVGVRLEDDGEITLAAPYGLAHIWDGVVTINEKAGYPSAVVAERVTRKEWLKIWPSLRLEGLDLNSAIDSGAQACRSFQH